MACNYICDKVCDKYTDEDIALSLVQTEVEISEIIRYVQHNLTNIVVCTPMLQKQPLKNHSLQSFQQYISKAK